MSVIEENFTLDFLLCCRCLHWGRSCWHCICLKVQDSDCSHSSWWRRLDDSHNSSILQGKAYKIFSCQTAINFVLTVLNGLRGNWEEKFLIISYFHNHIKNSHFSECILELYNAVKKVWRKDTRPKIRSEKNIIIMWLVAVNCVCQQ